MRTMHVKIVKCMPQFCYNFSIASRLTSSPFLLRHVWHHLKGILKICTAHVVWNVRPEKERKRNRQKGKAVVRGCIWCNMKLVYNSHVAYRLQNINIFLISECWFYCSLDIYFKYKLRKWNPKKINNPMRITLTLSYAINL